MCFGLLLGLMPLLARYALAKPNARSSHKVPTPQGGGIAVVATTVLVSVVAEFLFLHQVDEPLRFAIILASTVGLALVGATDDVRPLEAVPRLLLQTAAVAAVVATLPDDMRIVPTVPWWLDRAIMVVGGIWLVNVVNFMDGIDWMTVAEVVPVTAGLALFGFLGALPPSAALVAVALCGAVVGFAPFNRPVAQLFLGDVGSLPIGLLLGLAARATCGKRPFFVGSSAATLLFGRCDHHLDAPVRQGRAGHASASQSFLSTGARRRVQRLPDRQPRFFAECRACGPGFSLDCGTLTGNADDKPSCRYCPGRAPALAFQARPSHAV